MFEQAFKNIDDVLWKDAGCTSELDYTEQTSWLLFLKYLDALEQDKATETQRHAGRRERGSAGQHQGAAMKKGWQTKKLGDVCEFLDRRGVTPEKLGSKFMPSGFRVISAKNIKGREIDTTIGEQRFVDEPTYQRWMKSPLLADDVILTSEAPLGETAYVEQELKWCLGQRLFGVRSDKSKLHGRFLFYAFQASPVRDDMLSRATGATAQGIRQSELTKVELPLPPLAEQQRIVGLLDEAFAGLATAKANAEKNLQNARALFESHLQSVFTQRGPGWVETTLDKISTNLDSKRVPITKNVRTSGEYPCYGASGIVDYVGDYIFEGDNLLVSEDGANLLARSTPIAFSVSGKYWVNNHAHILHFENMATQRFAEFYLESIKLDDYITGAAQPKLNQKALNSIPIPIPKSVEAQAKIVDSVESLQEETQRLARVYERKHAALEALKKSLLHQAFAGEL